MEIMLFQAFKFVRVLRFRVWALLGLLPGITWLAWDYIYIYIHVNLPEVYSFPRKTLQDPVRGLGIWVRVQGFGFRVEGSGFKAQCAGC